MGALERLAEARVEALGRERLGERAQRGRFEALALEQPDRRRHSIGRLGAEQHAARHARHAARGHARQRFRARAPAHGLERAAAAEGDDRRAARERLDGHESEVLLAGEEQRPRARVDARQLLVVHPAAELGAGRGEAAQGALLLTAPHDDQPAPEPAAGLDGQIAALVGGEGPGQQVVAACLRGPRTGARGARGPPESRQVGGPSDDLGLAPVVAADPVGHVL